MNRRALVFGAGLGAIVALGLVVAVVFRDPERHEDGSGPLASVNEPVHDVIKADPASGESSWTFGVPLCVRAGSGPVTLSAIAPTGTVGNGFRLAGTAVREFVVSDADIPILSADGWPPSNDKQPDQIHPVSGFAVTTSCGHLGKGDYTELLIGLTRVGTAGGGWQGLEISYEAGGRRRVLTLSHDIQICGTTVTCEIPHS